MEEFIRQIRLASGAGLYYLALWGALTLPDICGALGSENGRATGPKYKAWIEEFIPALKDGAADIYGLRCSMLHQGRAAPHGGDTPVAFMAPGAPQIHLLTTETTDGDRINWLSIEMFVGEVTEAAERWYVEFGDTQRVRRNFEKFARLRPEGLDRHVEGPVIA